MLEMEVCMSSFFCLRPVEENTAWTKVKFSKRSDLTENKKNLFLDCM